MTRNIIINIIMFSVRSGVPPAAAVIGLIVLSGFAQWWFPNRRGWELRSRRLFQVEVFARQLVLGIWLDKMLYIPVLVIVVFLSCKKPPELACAAVSLKGFHLPGS